MLMLVEFRIRLAALYPRSSVADGATKSGLERIFDHVFLMGFAL